MEVRGVPYKGSKNSIAINLCKHIPQEGIENFYDVFAGGCAITNEMLKQNKYKHYYVNDLNGQGVQLFINAIKGKYRNERRWISREDFFALKDTDPYVSICWSFGNNQKTYLYNKDIEEYKKAIFEAIVYDNFTNVERLFPFKWGEYQQTIKNITDIYGRN